MRAEFRNRPVEDRRAMPQASLEDFDAAGAESSLKPEVMQLSMLSSSSSPEPVVSRSDQRGENLTGFDPLRFPLPVSARNPGVQAIQSNPETL